MDGWLKTLIAAACVVVITGGGYYAIKENANATRQVALEKQRQEREICESAEKYKGFAPDLHENCQAKGY